MLYKHIASSAGAKSLNVNGSITPVNFFLKPAEGETLTIYEFTISIVDTALTPTKFGGLTALTNGLLVKILDDEDTELFDFLDGVPIKQNYQFTKLSGSDLEYTAAAGDDHFPIQWNLLDSSSPIVLRGNARFNVKVQDDLSGLTDFRWFAQGVSSLQDFNFEA